VTTPKQYENYRRKMFKENAANFDYKNEELRKKIETFSKKTNYSSEEILKKIKTDEMFRQHFVIDPIRQNIYEKLVSPFIKKTIRQFDSDLKNIEIRKPKPSLVLNGKTIIPAREKKSSEKTKYTKTIDFEWKFDNKIFYAYHKYAKQGGGHQTNQYDDVLKFIVAANKVKRKNIFFLAITDGTFFNLNDNDSGKSRILTLKELANKTNTFALTSEELIIVLKQIKRLCLQQKNQNQGKS
jgi:hypothetical protein